MGKKRVNHHHQTNWIRNTYVENGKKYTVITGYNRHTGNIVKRIKIKRRA